MIGRQFDPSLIPSDPGHWRCDYCGCQSVNTVPEDGGLIDRNDRLILKFDTLDKIWKKFQADKEHT